MRGTAPRGGEVVRWRVAILGFLLIVLDGFDGVTLGLVIPTLEIEWGVDASAFTLPLVLTGIGTAVGYSGSGWASARFGRRRVILWGTTLFAIGSAWTAVVTTIPPLSVARLLTGVGLGVIVPPAASLAADNGPPRRRELITVLVSLGLAVGPTIGGILAGPLIGSYGWRSVLWVGTLLPVLLLPVLWWGMREPADDRRPPSEPAQAAFRFLFTRDRRSATLLLWAVFLLVVATIGVITTWAPVLVADYGLSPTEAPMGIAAFGFGGMLGGAVLVLLTTRFRAINVVASTTMLGALILFVAARAPLTHTGLLIALCGIGMCLIATANGSMAVAMSTYPGPLRTTGVGWAVALGRVGGVIGPAYAGALAAMRVSSRDIVLYTCVLMTAAALLNIVLAVRIRRRPEATEAR
ncbi:MFS transporter [Amycolatopsis keratiniphila]|uniref:MFS transporter n=1 Tax=Amycolatopsis keratiniphila TaxID=129921 RepID=UPI000618812E|nr:MFS transporter [Amycolatopsis keratiniphila]